MLAQAIGETAPDATDFGLARRIVYAITRSNGGSCSIYRLDRDQVSRGIDECSRLLYYRDRIFRFGTLYIALRAKIPALKRETLKANFR